MTNLTRSLESLGRAISDREAREAGKNEQQTPSQSAKILQFPLPFEDETRVSSNYISKSALFAAVKERQHFKDYVTVYEGNGYKIEFKGEQFNQDDNDTLLQLIAMANHKPFGVDVCQTVNAILRGIGRANQLEQRRQLFAQIDRLVSGTVRIITPQNTYIGHLIDDAITPNEQGFLPQHRRHLAYRLNPKFAMLYGEKAFTLFDVNERVKLKGRGSELAKWLHLWIIGNAEQYAHKVETIRERCGSTASAKEFKRILKQALDLLKNVCIIAAWEIDRGDLVHIDRIPSPSQQRHIVKKAIRKPKK